MAFTGSSHGISYEVETAFGTRTGTNMQLINITGTSLDLNKSTFTSETLREDQQIPGVSHGQKTVSGSIDVEAEHAAHNDLWAASIGGTWAAVTTGAITDIEVTGVAGQYATSSTDLDAKFEVGDVISIVGFTTVANNLTDAVVTAVTNNTITFGAETTVIEAAGDSVTLTAAKMQAKGGTAQPSYTFERRFINTTGGSDAYALIVGGTINGFNMTFDNDGIVSASFDVIAKDLTAGTVSTDATPLAATSNDPMTAVNASLLVGGVSNSVVKSVDLTLTRGMASNPVVGSTTTPFITPGRNTVTGSVTALFEDLTMYNNFINATETSLQVEAGDGTNYLRFTIPALKFNSGSIPVDSEGVIEISMDFAGYLDTTTNTNIIITRSS